MTPGRKSGETPSGSSDRPRGRGRASGSKAGAKKDAESYKVGDRVLCLHSDGLRYDAKITEIGDVGNESAFKVHYQGWNQRYDEYVRFGDVNERFVKYSDVAHQQAKEALKTARISNSKNKKKFVKVNDRDKTATPTLNISLFDTPGTTHSSRSTTPNELKRKQRAGSQTSISTDGVAPQSSKRSRKKSALQQKKSEPSTSDVGEPHNQTLDIFSQLPKNLVNLLIEDKRKIKSGLFVKQPTEYTVDKIVEQYVEKMESENEQPNADMVIEYDQVSTLQHTTAEMQKQIAYFIRDLFNATLRSKLLYSCEKKEHDKRETKFRAELEKAQEERDTESGSEDSDDETDSSLTYSKMYGLVHLTRLTVKFHDLLPLLGASHDSMEMGLACAQDFVVYLSKNVDLFVNLDTDYVAA